MSLRSEVIRIFNELLAGSKKITELPSATTPLAGTELIEIVQDGENRKVASSAVGGGAGVQTIVAGTNITVDDTDPQNPIVSSSGGGGSQDLQSVLDEGSTANIGNSQSNLTAEDASNYGQWNVTANTVEIANSNVANTAAATLSVDTDGAHVNDTRVNRGLQGGADYSANIQANDYTQKVYVDTKVASVVIIDSATPSTAGGTITLDMNSQIQRLFVGSASFSTPKTLAISNATNALVFNFHFQITDIAATLTLPSGWLMSDALFASNVWTPVTTGLYELGGSFDGTNWKIKIMGPFN